MSKFKPGDKVKVREDLEVGRIYGNYEFVGQMEKVRGKTVTIETVTLRGNYQLEEDCEGYIWTKEMFEPVPAFGKHLLRDGVIVKRRDNTYAIVIGNNTHSIKGFIRLFEYNNDLTMKLYQPDYDIMAIYTPEGFGSIKDLFKGEYLELIAERPEVKEEVKEMTLEEICKELGYNVKIVKEE